GRQLACKWSFRAATLRDLDPCWLLTLLFRDSCGKTARMIFCLRHRGLLHLTHGCGLLPCGPSSPRSLSWRTTSDSFHSLFLFLMIFSIIGQSCFFSFFLNPIPSTWLLIPISCAFW